jgi:HPt (histidine-containing phosphotransfer) domain-containing protein
MDSSPGSIDTSNILSVCLSGNTLDRTLLREMLDYFIHENERRMVTSQQALDAANRESLRQVAHAVRGSAALLGAGRLHDLAWGLEMDALTSELSTLSHTVSAIRVELEAVIAALHKAHPEAWAE